MSYPHDAVPIDINDLGQIVGQYVDGSGVTHGFELSDKKFTTLDVPFAGSDLTGGICTRWNERESTWRKSGSCQSRGTSQSRS